MSEYTAFHPPIFVDSSSISPIVSRDYDFCFEKYNQCRKSFRKRECFRRTDRGTRPGDYVSAPLALHFVHSSAAVRIPWRTGLAASLLRSDTQRRHGASL